MFFVLKTTSGDLSDPFSVELSVLDSFGFLTIMIAMLQWNIMLRDFDGWQILLLESKPLWF